MLNINIGGTKNWKHVAKKVRWNWRVLDLKCSDYVYNINSGEALPLEDNSVDNYYSSHTLEHTKPQIIPFLLKEIHRTLKKGGLIRIVVPNIQIAIKKYMSRDREWFRLYGLPSKPESYPNTILGHLMAWFYSITKHGENSIRAGHNMVFDWETLFYCFKQAGFVNITKSHCSEGSNVFRGLDFSKYEKISLYLEAQK